MPAPLNFPVPGFIPLALFDMLGLAAVGAPFMALACEIAGKTSRKVFLDKLAMQMAGMGVWAGLLSLAGSLACVFLGMSRFPALRNEWRGYQSEITAIAAAGGGVFHLPALLSPELERPEKGQGAPYVPGGAGQPGQPGFDRGRGGLGMRSASAVFLSGDKVPLGLVGALDAPGYSLMWPTLAACFGWCLSYGGAMAMVYLILRRNKDDFGRDYYTFAMPVAFPLGGVRAGRAGGGPHLVRERAAPRTCPTPCAVRAPRCTGAVFSAFWWPAASCGRSSGEVPNPCGSRGWPFSARPAPGGRTPWSS